jgi:hypothetical protein
MRAALLASICLAVLAGCGHRGPETAPVSGKVTYAGKPVADGTIMFWSAAGGTVATAKLGPDGSYRLATHPNLDGAVLGAQQVTIAIDFEELLAKTPGKEKELTALRGPVHPRVQIPGSLPLRYGERQTSGLKAEVKPGPNTIDFNLPAER